MPVIYLSPYYSMLDYSLALEGLGGFRHFDRYGGSQAVYTGYPAYFPISAPAGEAYESSNRLYVGSTSEIDWSKITVNYAGVGVNLGEATDVYKLYSNSSTESYVSGLPLIYPNGLPGQTNASQPLENFKLVSNNKVDSSLATATGKIGFVSPAYLDGGDETYASVLLLMNMNGTNGSSTLVDETGKTAITNYGVTLSSTRSKWGTTSAYFNGSSSFTATIGGYGSSTCIEMWIYLTQYAGSGNGAAWIYDKGQTGGVNRSGLYVNGDGSVSHYQYGSAAATGTSAAGVIPLNTWKHVAVTQDGSTQRIFVDGNLLFSVTLTGAISTWRFGASIAQDGGYFTGYMDDIRVSNTTRYTSTFTPPSSEFISYLFNARAAGTENMPTGIMSITPWLKYAVDTTNYKTGNSGAANLYPTMTEPAGPVSVDIKSYDRIEVSLARATGVPAFPPISISGEATNVANVLKNFWYYGADGNTATATPVFFTDPTGLDGVEPIRSFYKSKVESSVSPTIQPRNYVVNGQETHLISSSGDLYIDKVKLLMHFNGVDNGTVFNDVKGNVITGVGSAKTSATQSKFGDTSLYLAGGGNTASLTSAQSISLGTTNGSFTIEGWVYLTVGGRNIIMGEPSGSAYTTGWGFGFMDAPNSAYWGTSTKGICFIYSPINGYGGNIVFGGVYPTLNKWTHFAIVRETNNNWTFFVDGIKCTTQNANSTAAAQSQLPANNGPTGTLTMPLVFGNFNGFVSGGNSAHAAAGFNGYLDEFRITDGVARYTENFNVPTSPFSDTVGVISYQEKPPATDVHKLYTRDIESQLDIASWRATGVPAFPPVGNPTGVLSSLYKNVMGIENGADPATWSATHVPAFVDIGIAKDILPLYKNTKGIESSIDLATWQPTPIAVFLNNSTGEAVGAYDYRDIEGNAHVGTLTRDYLPNGETSNTLISMGVLDSIGGFNIDLISPAVLNRDYLDNGYFNTVLTTTISDYATILEAETDISNITSLYISSASPSELEATGLISYIKQPMHVVGDTTNRDSNVDEGAPLRLVTQTAETMDDYWGTKQGVLVDSSSHQGDITNEVAPVAAKEFITADIARTYNATQSVFFKGSFEFAAGINTTEYVIYWDNRIESTLYPLMTLPASGSSEALGTAVEAV